VSFARGALLAVALPLAAQRLYTPADFAGLAAKVAAQPWAASAQASIVTNAGDWPAAQVTRYELKEWQLPPEGGQWTAHYVCPIHGVSLQFQGPGKNICPVENKSYTGWPYDQVIYTRQHSDNAEAARNNGLAYRFTGKLEYARAAARILLAYADTYGKYPLHDKDTHAGASSTKSSAGRVLAQTLDEAIWLIPMAWGYDMIASSGVLSAAERQHIEQDLLRAAVAVIARNDAGTSNWQSWHNAGTGAVAFALADAALASKVIDGKSGFRFQMRNSVLADGVWLEGAWGYHFYALNAHTQLAEMAARAGLDLYADEALRKMYEAPLLMADPQLRLPPFNDSAATDLTTEDTLYEEAYARYGASYFAAVLGKRTRGMNALLWGAGAVPASTLPAFGSAVFPASGNAILRAAGSDHYLAFKFGPHGGGHGHYDKLGMTSYALGATMAVDPGTVSYAAPTHTTWDQLTVAHNTVVVDETTQLQATGALLDAALLPSIGAARASAGPAYKQAALDRTLILAPEYAIDVFNAAATDGKAHRFDWVYHNYGTLATALPVKPYTAFPSSNGYQNLSGARAAATAGDWQVSFDQTDPPGTSYGTIYVSPAGINATFSTADEQAASGRSSGRAAYDFRAVQGYILFGTPNLAGAPAEVPVSVSVMVYGDNSGHSLALRLYDTTDERFVYTVGPVNWTGWRKITADLTPKWNHYLGNADGVFDPPLHTVALELTSVKGGPLTGALYVDDIVLTYAAAGQWVAADFERPLRRLRVWQQGAEGTTVATGNGLGPNLLAPVPFAMSRRQGTATRFVSLLEPYRETPAVTAFRASSATAFQVTAAGFDDQVSFESPGQLRYIRRVKGALSRLGLAGNTKLFDAAGTLLLLVEPASPAQVDYSGDGRTVAIYVSGTPSGRVGVLAPNAGSLMVNGAPVAFDRVGEYIVYTVAPGR
jgi:hypothetical protein